MTLRVGPIGSTTATNAPTWKDYELQFFLWQFLNPGVINKSGNALQVTQRGAGANMSVDVAAGKALVQITNTNLDGTTYNVPFSSTATVNKVISAADPTNPRIDIVCLKVDVSQNPDSGAGNIASIVVVAGTPAGSPSVPATPTNHYKLAEVAVAAAAASIVNANITDRRAEVDLTSGRFPALALESEAAALRADSVTWLGTITGTNTLTGSATPVPTAYAAGQRFAFIVANTNSGAVTLNVNSLGAKNLYGPSAAALASGDLIINGIVSCRYDGTQFVMESPKHPTQNAAKFQLLASTSADGSAAGASSTAENNLDQNYAIPGNSVAAGDVFHVFASGKRTGSGPPTLTMRVKIGSVALFARTDAVGANNANWVIDAWITVRAINASGTVVGHATMDNGEGSLSADTAHAYLTTVSSAIDFTASQNLQISQQFNASNGSNTVTMTQFIVEKRSL